MKIITLKTKLFGLISMSLLGLLIVGAAGWIGLSNTAESVIEIGKIRLLSALGLEIIVKGQTAIL